jgi:hydrogenase nickel incorporation protein HypA/HybF
MHELSVALSIVELVVAQADEHKALAIEEVELEIGCLAGLDIPTFTFALESALKNTALASARIVRHDIAGEGQCGDCKAVFPMEALITPCPQCGSYAINITKGKELRVRSLVISK